MDVITTHINADFDGLAAMIAAKKLYPEAELVFAGSQEKNVRDFLAQEFSNIYEFKKIKHIDMQAVTRLIVVDTRHPGRIGRLKECLDNPGLELHLYDHHPDSPEDMRGSVEVIEPVGSTTTIFEKIFQERGIEITGEEATLMALGIYEDTGCFLHSTTTARDMETATRLLQLQANLDVVTQFVSHDLSGAQVDLLGKLLKQSRTYTIRSIDVVIVKLTLPEYVDDFAVLLRRLMVMENINVLFGLICMGERMYLIARSRIPEVNVGRIAREFGGGGHASAASATIKDMTLFEAEEKLIGLLHAHIKPKAIAGEIMSAPALTIPPDTSINEANSLLTRYNITVLPVVSHSPASGEDNQASCLQGMISRRVVEKAIFHKLGHLPVTEYMTTEIATLPTTATLGDIQELIIEHRQRLIPIMEGERLVGVITRTDLLNLLIGDPAHMPKNLLREDEHPSVASTRNLNALITGNLDKDTVLLLRSVGETAEELGYDAFVVGGFVRDLLLHIKNLDIDIVIEGDGIRFAEELARRRGGSVRTHEKFGTATVLLPDDGKIDVATARLEYYEYPAAMPTVELSSIKLDLFRRDFTINAMAIHLNPARFGTLVDFFNSQNDLKERRISVLHNLSFVEDPTRIFRAIRFEQRLDFRITPHTEKLIKNAVRMHLFDRFSGPRFFGELKQILASDNPLPALRRINEFSLFPFLWPDLRPNCKIDRRFIHLITQATRAISWFRLLYLDTACPFWAVYILAIMSRSRVKELMSFCRRFDLPPKTRKMLIRQKTEGERIAREMLRRPFMKASEIYWLLLDLDNVGLLYLMAIARKKYIKKAVSLFVTSLRDTVPLISGHDLLTLGFTPGPQFRTMINHVLEAQLNGVIQTKEDAFTLVKENYRSYQSKRDKEPKKSPGDQEKKSLSS
ncbi:MAG TPA: CBS domain-containing protein [Desulfobulbus sp.]|nr:CBS domain-containing protein [Desulfobulbus sp.]